MRVYVFFTMQKYTQKLHILQQNTKAEEYVCSFLILPGLLRSTRRLQWITVQGRAGLQKPLGWLRPEMFGCEICKLTAPMHAPDAILFADFFHSCLIWTGRWIMTGASIWLHDNQGFAMPEVTTPDGCDVTSDIGFSCFSYSLSSVLLTLAKQPHSFFASPKSCQACLARPKSCQAWNPRCPSYKSLELTACHI